MTTALEVLGSTATTNYAVPDELPEHFGLGRVCEHPGCDTILNRYHGPLNDGSTWCYRHEGRRRRELLARDGEDA